jgi:DNA-directed RNA polymerase subunit RPC12/RpoP
MQMWIVYTSSRPEKVADGEGYFNCPDCGCRQSCTLLHVRPRKYLYGFISLGDGEPVGPESYRCAGCGKEFVADGVYGYDFGAHPTPRNWRCFKCKGEVPYERFDCPHCGYRFETTR